MNSVTELRTMLREHGLRATAARLAVLKCLANAEGPLSHSEVCSLLSDRGFDRATVYRNLVDLTDRGILHRDDVGDHVWRFRFVSSSGSRPGSHPYFVCSECGGISLLPEDAVCIPFPERFTSTAHGQLDVRLRGVCNACA